jgi:pimeloyl-ACP methyl ester carboxylesterase
MLEEQAKLETVRPGRSLFVRKVRVGNVTGTNTNITNAEDTTTLQIVCVHGTCASEQQYHSMLEALHQLILADTGSELTYDYDTNNESAHNVSMQCLLPDLLGCGQSPPAAADSLSKNKDKNMDNAYSNEAIMADLTALMETHVDPNLPVVMMGHSYACNVILPMLLSREKKNPMFQNLTACIFLSSAVRCPENPNLDGGHWMMRSPYVPDMLLNYLQPSMTNAFVEMAVHPDHTALRAQVKEASNGNSMKTARAYHRNHKWYAPEVFDLGVPILVVHGAEDAIIPVAAGRSLAQSLSSVSSADQTAHLSEQQWLPTSNVEFVTVERAKHLVMMEQPDEVARAVWKFLRPLCVFKE